MKNKKAEQDESGKVDLYIFGGAMAGFLTGLWGGYVISTLIPKHTDFMLGMALGFTWGAGIIMTTLAGMLLGAYLHQRMETE